MVKLVVQLVLAIIVADAQTVIIVQLALVAINAQIVKLVIHNAIQTINHILNNSRFQLGSFQNHQ